MSLPNGIVSMEHTHCEVCPPSTFGSGVPWGMTCGGCGHHFHIGTGPDTPLIRSEPIFCPRCEGACIPVEVTEPAPPQQKGEVRDG